MPDSPPDNQPDSQPDVPLGDPSGDQPEDQRDPPDLDALLDHGPRTFTWQVDGHSVEAAYDIAGQGPPLLLLPALGPASTRAEMWPVARLLQDHFQTFTVDWPGFGAVPHPPLRWQTEHLRAFLSDLCGELFDGPVRVAAVGHAATYVLQVAAENPATWSSIAMIAPTWRCPLSTTLGSHRWLWAGLRRFVGLPLIGELLYRGSVATPILNRLYRGQLFGDGSKVTPRLIEEKARVCRQPNARYAAAAFITGALDPVRLATDYDELVQRQLVPVLAMCGLQTPSRPWREMAALLQRPEVTVHRIPGALAPHEEHPAPVSRLLEGFFGD